jgi:SAM-dependent methyltransferase
MPLSAFHRQADPAAAAAWFAGHAGQALLDSETGCVDDALRQRPGQLALWLGPTAAAAPDGLDGPVPLRLHWAEGGAFHGDLHCGLPLPLASESCAIVIVQHPGDAGGAHAALLEECARVLVAGGWLWLLALNPLSPYRLRWRGHGLRAREPVTWRKRLRAAGLAPDSLTRGLGPVWEVAPDAQMQDGVGLRAAFLLRAEKRRLPLTPLRKPRALALPAGTAA